MKKTNIIIFIVMLLIITVLVCYIIWGMPKTGEESGNLNGGTPVTNEELVQLNAVDVVNDVNTNAGGNGQNEVDSNQVDTNQTNTVGGNNAGNGNGNNFGNGNNGVSTNAREYIGDWYISEEAYRNAEEIDHILDLREDGLISDSEFESQMASDINVEVPELDIERCTDGQMFFDFTLTSPAPLQREGKLDDMVITLDRGVGTFTYTDNWGTRGNGTITLKDNQIELKLETTSAAQGALWGVEGIYTFSYKRID